MKKSNPSDLRQQKITFQNGAQTRNRTKDTRIFSPLLYLLSYLGIHHYLLLLLWWAIRDLNPGPAGYEPDALTN